MLFLALPCFSFVPVLSELSVQLLLPVPLQYQPYVRRFAPTQLAEKLADRADRDQKVVKLSPMSPHDRRVFHRALTDNESVRTESKGEGLYRNLLIIPAEYESARN